ncbi:MAG: radical SAM protein [Elusimicrobiota bacterium]
MKLAINTACNLHCKYCFVKKKNQFMSRRVAKRAVDLILGSAGRNKLIKIYGGEPLLNFGILKDIVLYAKAQAEKLDKDLVISPCTNLTLLTKEQVMFFKEQDLRLAISTDGDEAAHNANRIFKDGTGSFAKFNRNLDALLKHIPETRRAANLGVTPALARAVFSNFAYLIERGFDTVNLEPIQGVRWSDQELVDFKKGVMRINRRILDNIRNNRKNIFLTPINRELKYQELSEAEHKCLFYSGIDVYPAGDITFSVFFMNALNPDRHFAGNTKRILSRYRDCRYEKGSGQCGSCRREYYRDSKIEPSSARALQLRNLLSIGFANNLKKMAAQDMKYSGYIGEAKEHICF